MTTNYYKTYLLALLASLALLLPMESRAQQMQAALSHYTTDDGLPSTAISSLVSDDYGYLWISTWNGLARFDGFDFYTYKTGILSGVRGMHNRVASATIDQGQNIWMKMYDGRWPHHLPHHYYYHRCGDGCSDTQYTMQIFQADDPVPACHFRHHLALGTCRR